ncbi:MAG: DUF481 domain-containing protein [Betaproteobacteria bacterium]
MSRAARVLCSVAPFVLLLGAPATGLAQPKPVGWTTTANLSGVLTGGNTAALSFGLKARTERNWLRTQYYLEGGGIRQDAVDKTKYAVGTPDSFTVTELSVRNKKAENYFGETGFERRVTERFFWTVNGGFKRDLFSGVEQLLSGRAGVGYYWTDRSAQELKLGLDATYNHQKEKVPNPDTKENWAGGRLSADYAVKFGNNKQSAFTSKLALDQNLQVSKDFRALWDNALTVSVSRRLALQLGGKLDFRNLPALQEVALFAAAPAPGASSNAKVTTPFQKTDVWLTVSFVLNWAPQGPSGDRPTP